MSPHAAATSSRAWPRLLGFVSYAHADIDAMRTLRRQYRATEQAYGVQFWDDEALHAGQAWRPEIQKRIDAAHLFLLMVSDYYFESSFIRDHELPAITRRLGAHGTLFIPVILRPCGWRDLLGDVQAVPTANGNLVSIERWPREHDGYNRAREQITAAVQQVFGLTPQLSAVANKFHAIGQNPGGAQWWRDRDQFARDLGGPLAFGAAPPDPSIDVLHQEVTRLAVAFAATAVRMSNAPGWSGIDQDARRLAEVVAIPAEDVPSRLTEIYLAARRIVSFAEMDRRLREGPPSLTDPLEPRLGRDLKDLADTASLWLRQYAPVSVLDSALSRAGASEASVDDARAMVERAGANGIVSGPDADAIAAPLAAKTDGMEQQHAALGALNLLYRIAGEVVAEALTACEDQSQLARRGQALLRDLAAETDRMVAGQPVELQVALSRARAGEGTADSNARAEDQSDPSVIVPDETIAPPPGWPGRPNWADDAGLDRYGGWATFSITSANGRRVTQRMRWCPPGEFMMGSPDSDKDAEPDERRRHRVSFAEGFWIFDTAVTEALWTVVMQTEPRNPLGPRFPVADVDWNEAQDFVRRLNEMLPGLGLSLPSEAAWEYACRADTSTRYSFGDRITKKQVCFDSRQPVPVASLPANPWGLFEMHGNVFEWCLDHYHRDYHNAPDDGSAWVDASASSAASRVVRGGSWLDGAAGARAAYRLARPPGAPLRLPWFSLRPSSKR